MVVPLLRRHRVDHRFDVLELLAVERLAVRGQLLQISHPRDHPENLFERPHLLDRPQLVAKILERELVAAQLLFELLGVLDRDRFFRLLDERQHVAHAEHARDDAIGMERLEILQPLAAAGKRDRHADDADDRQRRAAAGIAVHLAEDDAGDAHAAIELARALDRVLPGHRVGDVEQVGRLRRLLDRLQLHHQLVVDVEAAGGVDDDDVEAGVAGLGQRAARALHGIHLAGRVVYLDARLLRNYRELFDGRGPPDVGRYEQRVPALLREPARQLAGRGRLAGALQPEQQDDARPRLRRRQSALRVAEQRQHLVAHDPHDLLRRGQAAQHFLVDRLVADAVDERLDDLEVDVGLEQRHADFPQRDLDGLLREADLTAEGLEDVLKACAE